MSNLLNSDYKKLSTGDLVLLLYEIMSLKGITEKHKQDEAKKVEDVLVTKMGEAGLTYKRKYS